MKRETETTIQCPVYPDDQNLEHVQEQKQTPVSTGDMT